MYDGFYSFHDLVRDTRSDRVTQYKKTIYHVKSFPLALQQKNTYSTCTFTLKKSHVPALCMKIIVFH